MSKTIYLCPNCKSHRVYAEAWSAINCDDVLTYDHDRLWFWLGLYSNMICLACEEEFRTPLEVTLPEGFDGDLRDPDLILHLENTHD